MKNSVPGDKKYIKFNTNQEKKGKLPGKPRILVAPLDWGLGHATRCIPIIHELIRQDRQVWLAGDGAIEKILRGEFPQLPFLELPGYHIRYSRSGKGLIGAMIRQFPRIISAIRFEHKWLKNQLARYQFDAVISDNRFGLNSIAVPCVFITHQLAIKSPMGKWSEKWLRRLNYLYINRFSECWIPDLVGERSLAGDLSHPEVLPDIPIFYIDLVSRFSKIDVEEKKRRLVVIMSGPEPQRSIFENLLIDQLVLYNGTVDFIRGTPVAETILPSTNQLNFYNHLPSPELNKKIAEAEFVISRAGYSTVMDLVQVQKKSILIPTPGQTEQEYLADHLTRNHIAFCIRQENFVLKRELDAAKSFPFDIPATGGRKLEETIKEFIGGLG